jgi:hypothetical protein
MKGETKKLNRRALRIVAAMLLICFAVIILSAAVVSCPHKKGETHDESRCVFCFLNRQARGLEKQLETFIVFATAVAAVAVVCIAGAFLSRGLFHLHVKLNN